MDQTADMGVQVHLLFWQKVIIDNSIKVFFDIEKQMHKNKS